MKPVILVLLAVVAVVSAYDPFSPNPDLFGFEHPSIGKAENIEMFDDEEQIQSDQLSVFDAQWFNSLKTSSSWPFPSVDPQMLDGFLEEEEDDEEGTEALEDNEGCDDDSEECDNNSCQPIYEGQSDGVCDEDGYDDEDFDDEEPLPMLDVQTFYQSIYSQFIHLHNSQPTQRKPSKPTSPPPSNPTSPPVPAFDECSSKDDPPVLVIQASSLPEGKLHEKSLLHAGICYVKSKTSASAPCVLNGKLTTCDSDGNVDQESALDFELCPAVQAISMDLTEGSDAIAGAWDIDDKPIGAVESANVEGIFGISAKPCSQVKRFAVAAEGLLIEKIRVWKYCDFYCR
ncbi:hypothetical protein P9112_005553 [Eukaryota sp. TZLM1-RC]